tara:strand:+ start:1661 stop:2296 length:636 start_codon:yes stop_codon:yes gene_type:complete
MVFDMKTPFLLLTLLICSVSFGQSTADDIYLIQKKNLTHIRCLETPVITFDVKMESIEGAHKLGATDIWPNENTEDVTSYFAFNEKFFFQMLDGHEKFVFTAKKIIEQGWNGWYQETWDIFYPPVPSDKELLINDNVIRYSTKFKLSDVDDDYKDDYKLSTASISYTIDHITGGISRKNIISVKDDDESNMDVTTEFKGTCSPYNPDQRTF